MDGKSTCRHISHSRLQSFQSASTFPESLPGFSYYASSLLLCPPPRLDVSLTLCHGAVGSTRDDLLIYHGCRQ
ncbi:hypothetical protein CesoFtcFv8_021717 [Champsocephalus esox]|uniref:Uncharacterized protein n=1 Tax=Champsocephalus esox TaxID=159716 RepID=A0AAN8GKG0_9TELE|nr:hypothetical protein CesoFtcFv8_021717 [Champsocephalus esox]